MTTFFEADEFEGEENGRQHAGVKEGMENGVEGRKNSK